MYVRSRGKAECERMLHQKVKCTKIEALLLETTFFQRNKAWIR
jgi:hypothetical protein